MSSREAILSRIRQQLAGHQPPQLPPVPEVWPRTAPPLDVLAARFQEELRAVHGECFRCASTSDARAKILHLADEAGWNTVGFLEQPLVRQLVEGFPAERGALVTAQWTAQQIAELPVGLVGAELLLADTGSAMVACRQTHERLMCYLPPACLVVARTDQLFEHMPAAWEEAIACAANSEFRGELLFLTGPSRTADIEKILILGVHGPKRLVVLLVD